MGTFTAFSALAIICCAIPMWWHIRNRNLACCYLVGWLIVSNLMGFVNSIIWPDDERTFNGWNGAILCDIEAKLLIAANTGQCGCVAAIARNLAIVLSTSSGVFQTKAMRTRRMVIDLLFCFGIPVYMISVHYIVQPNRYYLIGGMGCMPPVDNSWPSIVLLFIWPLILTLAAVYYSVLVIWRMHMHRKEFTAILRNSHSNLTTSRFIRLFLVACTLLFIYVPINIYIFYLNISVPRLPYSWSAVHDNLWHVIYRFPSNPAANFDRWAPLIGAYMVFFFFGIGTDAMVLYRGVTSSIGIDKYIPSWDGKSRFMSKLHSFTSSLHGGFVKLRTTSNGSVSTPDSSRGARFSRPSESSADEKSSVSSPWAPKLRLAPTPRFEITAFEVEPMGKRSTTPPAGITVEKTVDVVERSCGLVRKPAAAAGQRTDNTSQKLSH